MTAQGAEKLRRELHDLKTITRPKVIHDIATARAHGDLKENAEYHAAREQQSFVEGRIHELENKLAHAQIIDIATEFFGISRIKCMFRIHNSAGPAELLRLCHNL